MRRCAAASVLLWSVLLAGVAAQAPAPQQVAPAVNPSDDPLLKVFRWRSIGPANMGGRIDDIAAAESDPQIPQGRPVTGARSSVHALARLAWEVL